MTDLANLSKKDSLNNKIQGGIYIDIISNKPLFSSLHKFESTTSELAFFETIAPNEIQEFGSEVKSKSGTLLGTLVENKFHVNSAAVRFVPKENMFADGFGELLKLFSKDEAIILAGGCFWGMEHLLLKLKGVLKTRVGYCGGMSRNPTYEEICTGETGHAESVEVLFNPNDLDLEDLLKYFFQIHDPTTPNKQGNDTGSQYRSAIFYFTERQKNIAENIKLKAEISGVFQNDITTEIEHAGEFWEAEKVHQKYLIKNPSGYSCHFVRNNWRF